MTKDGAGGGPLNCARWSRLVWCVACAIVIGAQPGCGGGSPPEEDTTTAINPLVQHQLFEGRYRGEGIQLELRRGEAGALVGELTLGGEALPVRAQVQQGRLTGTFRQGENEFSFEASWNDSELELISESARLTLRRESSPPSNPLVNAQQNQNQQQPQGPTAPPAEPQNPLAGGASPENPLAGGPRDLARGEVLRHPLGIELNLASGWKTEWQEGLPLLVPPDVRRSNNGYDELYIVHINSSWGARTVNDEPIRRGVQMFAESMLPQFTGGQSRAVDGGTVVYEWTGKSATGASVASRVYVHLLGGQTLWLWAVGEPTVLASRAADLERAMASARATAAMLDPALVGQYFREEFSSDRTMSIRDDLIFEPDGSFRGSTRMIAAGISRDVSSGHRWAAANGYFYRQWAGDFMVISSYRVRPTGLTFRNFGEQNEQRWLRAQ